MVFDMGKNTHSLIDRFPSGLSQVLGKPSIDIPLQSTQRLAVPNWSNYWLDAVQLQAPDMKTRNKVLAAANDAGYQCRPAWTLLHRLPMYTDCLRDLLPVAESLEASLINIPSSARLAKEGS